MHTTAEKLCTCDLDTPKNGVPGSFCSHKVFVIAVQLRCVNENSAGRATDCPPIKINHLERYTSPEWPAHASNNRRSAPHAFGPRKRPGNSLHSKCARNGTAAIIAAGSTSRKDEPLSSSRSSSCAAPSQQLQPATEWSRDDERRVAFES